MAGTLALTVKDNLFDRLVADTNIGGAGVQVQYGFKASEVESETVVIGNVDWDDEQWGPFGNKKRDEFFRVGLYVFTKRPGAEQQECTERGLTLFQYVEAVVLADPTLSGAVIVADMVPRQVVELPTPEGPSVMVEGEVRVRARK